MNKEDLFLVLGLAFIGAIVYDIYSRTQQAPTNPLAAAAADVGKAVTTVGNFVDQVLVPGSSANDEINTLLYGPMPLDDQ